MATNTKSGTGRPKAGYFVDGEKVSGVTTIVGRFKESGGLLWWANRLALDPLMQARNLLEGFKAGQPDLEAVDRFLARSPNDFDHMKAKDAAANAGTLAHEMIDCALHGREFVRDGHDAEALAKADHAFKAFLEWKEQSKLEVVESELSLVSKVHKFGGTIDALNVGGSLRLGDYKTSNSIYQDMLIQVAGGYAILWDEHFPDRPLTGMEIIRISKPKAVDDPVSFAHHFWGPEIFPIAKRQFLLFREAYELDKRLKGLL